jgi:hypothetical protein
LPVQTSEPGFFDSIIACLVEKWQPKISDVARTNPIQVANQAIPVVCTRHTALGE